MNILIFGARPKAQAQSASAAKREKQTSNLKHLSSHLTPVARHLAFSAGSPVWGPAPRRTEIAAVDLHQCAGIRGLVARGTVAQEEQLGIRNQYLD